MGVIDDLLGRITDHRLLQAVIIFVATVVLARAVDWLLVHGVLVLTRRTRTQTDDKLVALSP